MKNDLTHHLVNVGKHRCLWKPDSFTTQMNPKLRSRAFFVALEMGRKQHPPLCHGIGCLLKVTQAHILTKIYPHMCLKSWKAAVNNC